MDLNVSGQLSNAQPALEALADLDIGVPLDSSREKAHPPDRIPRLNPRTSRPLKPTQVNALIAGYQLGKTMKELAAEFGVNRLTVSAHLRRAGVPIRRCGLDHDQADEAVRLYKAGWSSRCLAARFGVSADTVLKALRSAKVSIRPRRGGPSPNTASS